MSSISKDKIVSTEKHSVKSTNYIRPKVVSFGKMLRGCPLPIFLFVLALLVPSEISIKLGSIRLTPYKVVLIVVFVPSVVRLFGGKVTKFNLIDFLVLFHLVWSFIVIEYHHGSSYSIESGGLRFLELGGTYLLARTYIRDEKSFYGMFAVLILFICILAPITLVESITGKHLIKEIASTIGGKGFYNRISPRFGFARAYGPFDHPILYGVFSASVFGIAYYLRPARIKIKFGGLLRQFMIALAAVTSVSSGAVAALSTQGLLIGWDILSRKTKGRWKILVGGIVFVYVVVDILANRSAIKVFLTYLSFSAHTAYNRIIIFNYGIQDVLNNPIFGIGFNVWTRPSWMHSTSMDNFWLVQAVTFGFPGFFSLALAVILMLSRKWKTLDPTILQYRKGWTISMIGIILTACTVHFWNNSFAYFGLLLGAGMWFLAPAYHQKVKEIPTSLR